MLVRCNVVFEEPSFPVDEVNVYRVIHVDYGFHARIDIDGHPEYFSLINNSLIIHSRVLHELVSNIDVDSCEPGKLIDAIFDEVVYRLGINRTRLFEELDEYLESVTEGRLRDLRMIRDLRKRILILYLDSSSLYYASRKLTKYLDKETQEDVLFAYERAELLLARSAELYNIYLTEVQNELNIIIKKLTSISFIFLPITAIASLYAVTYPSLPSSLYTPYTVYFLAPLVILGLLMTIYLKKIGWL